MGLQRASLCGKPFEACVMFIFQIYCNSFVKARLEARGIKALKKLCGRPFEVRVAFIFQIYCNSFVKARPEARGI